MLGGITFNPDGQEMGQMLQRRKSVFGIYLVDKFLSIVAVRDDQPKQQTHFDMKIHEEPAIPLFGRVNCGTLQVLNNDCITQVFTFCTLESLGRIMQTCRFLHKIAIRNRIWCARYEHAVSTGYFFDRIYNPQKVSLASQVKMIEPVSSYLELFKRAALLDTQQGIHPLRKLEEMAKNYEVAYFVVSTQAHELVLITWLPDVARIKQKIIFASSGSTLALALNIKRNLTCVDIQDLQSALEQV